MHNLPFSRHFFCQFCCKPFEKDRCVWKTGTNGAFPIHNWHPDRPPSPAFMFCIPSPDVIQKPETPECFSLSPSLTLTHVPPLAAACFPSETFPHTKHPPPFYSPRLTSLLPSSLGSPALGCQMYYRVKHSNVNTVSCHGCRVVWPSPFRPLRE